MRSAVIPIFSLGVEGEIQRFLDHMVARWNCGDLKGFLEGYADDALMKSSSGMASGIHEIRRRYREAYPDASTMGELYLEVDHIRPVVDHGRSLIASVWVRWALGDDSGVSLLVLRHRPRWEIVEECTT